MNPPSTAEELERKTIETIEWLVKRRQDGFASDDQLTIAAEALWKATSGLFPPASGMADIMTELMNLTTAEAKQIRRSLCDTEGNIITFVWKIGYSQFTVMKRQMGTLVGGTSRTLPDAAQAKLAMDQMVAGLIEKGWTLL